MAVQGYNYDRGAVEKPDTWADTFRDTGLAAVGGLARSAGEIGQGLGAKEFAEAMRGVEKGTEEQTSDVGKEVAKAAFVPTEEGETSVFKHPVRSALRGAVNLGTSLPAYLAGAAAGSAVGGPIGGIVGGTLVGSGQGFGAVEYEARKRVEGMTPEQKRSIPVWQDAYAQSGDDHAADEALVTALHPHSAEILGAISGGIPGGATTHAVTGAIGKAAAGKLAMGIAPKVLPRVGIMTGEQALALGASSGIGEAGRQTGDISAGLATDYDPLKILKSGVEGAIPGALFGAHAGLGGAHADARTARRARTAREQFDAATATLNEGLEGAYPAVAHPAEGLTLDTAAVDPVSGNRHTVDLDKEAALKASTATGGGNADAIQRATEAAHAAGEQAGEQISEQQAGGTQAGPPAGPPPAGAGAGTGEAAPVTPPVTTEVTAPTAPTPPTAPRETYQQFHDRVVGNAHADPAFGHQQFQDEYDLWKAAHNEGESHANHGVTQSAVKEIKIAREVAAKAAKDAAKKAPDVTPKPEPVAGEQVASPEEQADIARSAARGAELEAEAAAGTKTANQKAAALAREQVEALQKKGTQPKEATKAGDRGTDKLGKEFTWTETERNGEKVLVRKYDTPKETTARTKEADAAAQQEKVAAAVAEAPAVDLRARAEARREELVKRDREKRAADKAAGRPVKFADIPTVEELHRTMEEEHEAATHKAETAKLQAENLQRAAETRTERKAETEATEEVAHAAAKEHIENLSEDHVAHGDEEAAAAALVSNANRDVARKRVIERARKMVSDIEDKTNSTISGVAKWSKEGKVKQNVLNALRDTKALIKRWDTQHSENPKVHGSLKARDLRAAKINQGFVDHLETMYYLREGNTKDLGQRREERSKQRTQNERSGGGTEKQRAGETRKGTLKEGEDDLASGAEHLGMGDEEHETERTGRQEGEREDLSEHGFSVDEGDDYLGAKGPTVSVKYDERAGNQNGPFLPDHLVDKRFTYKSLKRLKGHEALKNLYESLKKTLKDLGPEDPPEAEAYFKHVMELVARMRSVVPHIPVDYISDKDWHEFTRYAFGRDGTQMGGVFARNAGEASGAMIRGRIIMPERLLHPNLSEAHDFVLIHEFGHSATIQAYDRDVDFKHHTDSLYEAYKKASGDKTQYGLTDPREFLTEGMSNYTMVHELSTMEAPRDVVAYVQGLPKPTVKMSMYRAFVGLIARALGIPRPKMSMLDALMRMNEDAMQRGTEITDSRSDRRVNAAAEGGSLLPMHMPTGDSIRRGITQQVLRSRASGSTFMDRWKAIMLNAKTTKQIAQGMDHLFGRLDALAKNSKIAARALDLLPDDLRKGMADKPLSRVYNELHERMNARAEKLLKTTGAEDLTRRSYELQRQYGLEGTSPDGKGGSMWDFYTNLRHDETVNGAYIGGESNKHLDPKKLDHAQSLARLPELEKRYAMLPDALKDQRREEHSYYERSQKAMSDFLSDNTVDELTDMIRETEKAKAVGAPIHDKAGMDDFKQWLRNKRPDTHPLNDLYKNILAIGPAAKRLKDIRALAEIAGPYTPLMRRGNHYLSGYHELADAPGQVRRLDKAGETFDPTNTMHTDRAHEFNTYEFPDEATAKPFIEGSDFKAMNTGEKLINKKTNKAESVPQPKKNAKGEYETNYGGKNEVHANRADAIKARDAFIAANYDKRIHTTLQNKEVQYHRSATDLELAKRSMADVKGFKLTESGQRAYEKHAHGDDLSDEIRSVRNAMEKSEGFSKLDTADQQVLRDVLSQHSLRVLGGTRVQSRRLPRRNVLGASEDLSSNLAEYAHSTAGYVARLEYGPHINRVVDAMKEQVKLNAADKDAYLRSAVMNEFDKRRDQVAPPDKDSLTQRVINRLLQVSYMKRLASPAFHVINAQEPWMIGLPYLAGEHGLWKSMTMMRRAYSAIGGRDIAWQGIKETGKAFASDKGMDFGGRIRDRLKGDDQRALDDLGDRGLIGRDAGMEFSKLASDSTNIAGRTLDRADHISRQMGQSIEAINRSVVGLTAYWLAKEKGLSHEHAVEKAAEAIDNTMGSYDRWNAPPIFNKPLGRLALQFHKYGQRQYYLLGKLGGGMLKGPNKLENAKAFGLLMGTHFIMAGALGLPTEPILMAVNVANTMGLTDETSDTLTNTFRETLAAHFGKEVGQFVSTGAVNTFFGIDTASRMGLNQLLSPFGAPKSGKQDDIFNYYAKWMAGSAPSMVMEFLDGLHDVANGNWANAAPKLSPIKVLGDSAKGTINMMSQKTNPSGRKAGEQLTGYEAFVQGAGFRPSRIAEAAAAKNTIYGQGQDFSKNETSLKGNWVKATSPAERQDAQDAIDRWNAQQGSSHAKINRGDLIKAERAARRSDADALRQGLPAGARVNKKVPEIGERAKATYAYQ